MAIYTKTPRFPMRGSRMIAMRYGLFGNRTALLTGKPGGRNRERFEKRRNDPIVTNK